MAAFAQLAVVGRGNNTCVYAIAIFTMCESVKRHTISRDLFERSSEDVQFLKNTVTDDWFYGYDPGTKQQSSQ